MKVILPILCLLVVLGVVYGAAKVGILPAQQIADKNANLAPILRSLHLAKATKNKSVPAVKMAADPAPKPAAPQQALTPPPPLPQAGRGGARVVLTPPELASQSQAIGAGSMVGGLPASDAAQRQNGQPERLPVKLSAIYAAMPPDDLARVLSKLPDPTVAQTLLSLDPKKAGKVLAALPDTRAAHLTTLMMKTNVPAQTAAAL